MRVSKVEILLNVLFWISSAWLVGSSYSVESIEIENINGVEQMRIQRGDGLIVELLTLVNLSMLMFYTNLSLTIRYHQKKLKALSISAIVLFVTATIAFLVNKFTPHLHPTLSNTLILGILLFYFSISVAYALGKIWMKAEKQQQMLKMEKQHYQLTLLRNQLQPHFLFNSLNNLLSMVHQKNNEALADSIEKLSSLLRYVLEENSSEKVPLEKEIQFIRDFADLQLLRYEQNEVSYHFKITGNYQDVLIEPGLFISFVENAFKFGTRPEMKSHIDISLNISVSGVISFKIFNPILENNVKKRSNSTGISNIKKRLELVYPEKYKLDIQKDSHFNVTLEIETDESYNNR